MALGRQTSPGEQTDGWLNADRLRRHVIGYIGARLALTFLLGGVLVWQQLQSEQQIGLSFHGGLRLIVLSLSLLILSGLGLVLRLNTRSLALLQLLADAVIITDLVTETEGVKSFFGGFYIISIVASAYLVPRAGTLVTAFAYAGIFAAVGYADIEARGGVISAADVGALASQVVLRVFAFVLAGVLASRLGEELRATERALARETARITALQEEFARVVGMLRSGIALFDADGALRSANAPATRLFPALATRPADQVIPGYGGREEGVWEVALSEGAVRNVLFTRTPLEGGGSVVTMEDVTPLREMEREVQRQERMAAAGRFAAGVAHEVRNPLAALSSAVQMLEVNEQDRVLQDIILREVDRLDRLVAQFLETAEPAVPNMESVDVGEIVTDVAEAFGRDRRFAGRIRLALSGGDASRIQADPDQIRQILWNLLLNAAQATSGGGTVEVSLADLGERVSLRVRDEGVGIPEHELSQIFDPFFSGRSGGTGLGLATVDRIVRAHGGQVRVQSKLGEGSLFEVVLPKVQAARSATGIHRSG